MRLWPRRRDRRSLRQRVTDLLRPDACVASVLDIRPDDLYAHGIRAVMVDLDNTLLPFGMSRLAPEVEAWVHALQSRGIKFAIVSNTSGAGRVQHVARLLEVPAISAAIKPSRRAFRKMFRLVRVGPRHCAVIGDQLFTDVLGGNRLRLHTILVTPLASRDFITTKVVRLLERHVLRMLNMERPPLRVRIYDAAGNPTAGFTTG